jgi:hypothetical protein
MLAYQLDFFQNVEYEDIKDAVNPIPVHMKHM